jgi:hypothetical protein
MPINFRGAGAKSFFGGRGTKRSGGFLSSIYPLGQDTLQATREDHTNFVKNLEKNQNYSKN